MIPALIARIRELEGERDAAREENRWAYIQAALDDNQTEAQATVATLTAQVEAMRGAVLNLPAVYAHQINTGVREVYDPLQRFYTMESVLDALTETATTGPKDAEAREVLTEYEARMRGVLKTEERHG